MLLKTIHVSCAALTAGFFLLRGFWMLTGSKRVSHVLTRVLPHVIDTALLVTGLVMAITIYGAFYTQKWLLGKLAAVVVYIVLGAIALRYGRTKTVRTVALLSALCVFAYVVFVAHTHSLVPA